MSVVSDAAQPRGDVMRRLAELERQVQTLQTARRLEAASVGRGGVRVKGGRIVIEDEDGNETLVAASDGLSLQGVLSVLGSVAVTGGGDITVTDGSLVARDEAGDVFRVDPTVPEIFMRKALISGLVDEIVAELLTSPSGEELAAFVIGQRVHGDSADAEVSSASGSYVSLSGGPSVSSVPISSSGVAIVGVQASLIISPAVIGAPSSGALSFMSYEISGATSRSPADNKAYRVGYVDIDEQSFIAMRAMAFTIETGLNEGNHTFAARYRVDSSAAADWALRRILVIGL